MPSNIKAICLVLSTGFLAACAQPGTQSKTTQAPGQEAGSAPVATRNVQVPVQPPSSALSGLSSERAPASAPPPAKQTIDGLVEIEFDPKLSVLSDSDHAMLAELADSAKLRQRIVVTGYCDRSVGTHAKEIALARAVAVKNELVKDGVSSKIVRIKYVTAQPRHGVTIEVSEH